jgi:hypothetical protein
MRLFYAIRSYGSLLSAGAVTHAITNAKLAARGDDGFGSLNEPATAGKRYARGVASGEGSVNQVMNRR